MIDDHEAREYPITLLRNGAAEASMPDDLSGQFTELLQQDQLRGYDCPACYRSRRAFGFGSGVEVPRIDERKATTVEMKFPRGTSAAEISQALGVSRATVNRDRATARIWLRRQMQTTV